MVGTAKKFENGQQNGVPEVSFASSGGSRMKTALICLTLFLLATTIIFLILFIVFYIRYDKETDKAKPCNSEFCVKAADMIISKMNITADPCLDFHEYACGRFSREAVIAEGRTQTGTFVTILENNERVIKEFLSEAIKPDDLEYFKNMKRIYASCMNEEQIEIDGLYGYLNDTKYSDDWPTRNPTWDNSTFNLKNSLLKYSDAFVNVFYVTSVGLDLTNSNVKVLYLSDVKLGLSQEYYVRPNTDPVLVAYKKYLVDTAVVLDANPQTAQDDASRLIELERALANIMPSVTDRHDIPKLNNPTNLTELASKYPDIFITEVLTATYSKANVTLTENDTIINFYPNYISNISAVLANFSNRDIQNFFGFKYALSKTGGMTKKMREIELQFDKVYFGKTEEGPRWKTCLDATSALMPKGISKQFVTRTFTEEAKQYMDELIDNLMKSFKDILTEATWMGAKTKESAYKKLAAMKRKIGYPSEGFTDKDIDDKYKLFTISAEHYRKNIDLALALTRIENLADFRKPIDRNQWIMEPYVVNAYYSLSDNEIAFPAGILQSPLFSLQLQNSINYAAIGMIIGHEITHGFDVSGSRFNENGNLENWWQPSDLEIYLQKTKCIIDQYSAYYFPSINMSVNGVLTQGENVADNGGLKESYRAYKALVSKKGEQPKLPGLDLSQDQLFFLAFGQAWCDKRTNQSLMNMISTDPHSPAKFRIIGPLQNSQDFAKAFKCAKGSYMNPEKKCAVW